jgi:hypothetical protein
VSIDSSSGEVSAAPSESSTAVRIEALRRFAIAVLIAGALGGVIGWALSSTFGSVRWRAITLVQVGQVGVYPALIAQPIEPVTRALERMRSPAFLHGLLARVELPVDELSSDPDAIMLRRSLRVSSPRNSDLLEIVVENRSAADARKIITQAVDMLAAAHAALADPLVGTLKTLLAQADTSLAAAMAERDRILPLLDTQRDVRASDRFSESVLLASALKDRDAEIRLLQEQRVQLHGLLSPSRTFTTSMLGADAVTVRRYGPDRGLGTMGGASIGIALALLSMRLRRGR